MDKKTFLQFIAVSAVILLVWNVLMWFWYAKRAREMPQAAPIAAVPGQEAPPAEGKTEPAAPEEPTAIAPAPEGQPEKVSDLVLANQNIESSWTNRGASLERLKLLNYKAAYFEDDGKTRAVLSLLRDFQDNYLSDVIEKVTLLRVPGHDEVGWSRDVATANVLYKVVEQAADHIVFEGTLDPRLSVRKTVRIAPDTYSYAVELEFINRAPGDVRFRYSLRGPAGLEHETLATSYVYTAVAVRKGTKVRVTTIAPRKLEEGSRLNESLNIAWAGLVNPYFVALLEPTSGEIIDKVESKLVVDDGMRMGRGRWAEGKISPKNYRNRFKLSMNNAAVVIVSKEITLQQGQRVTHAYRMIAAPKLQAALAPYGEAMPAAVRSTDVNLFTFIFSFGTLTWLTPVMIAILKFFHSIIPNYGVAILLMTLMIRVILHPLSRMTYSSMRKMQLLQPKLTELRKKHADDQQKMVQEQFALYRKYGVHPLRGCGWPMLLQMPVLLALYMTFRSSVELRHAVFIPGWINDLSQPDTVWHLPWYLPFFENELNILPFVMTVTWWLNQKMAPKSGDPQMEQQQKIFQWMTLLFGIIMYHLASGLLVYWTASSALAILEQWLIRRSLAGVDLATLEEQEASRKRGKKKTGEPEKQGWFSTLMERMDKQQKRSQQARRREDKDRD